MNLLLALCLKAKLFILAAPIACILSGAAMNQSVLIANGGKFPVMINDQWASKSLTGEWLDNYHCRMTAQTHLNFLADYIDFHVAVKSPGDLLLELGEFLADYTLVVWGTVVVMELSRQRKAVI